MAVRNYLPPNAFQLRDAPPEIDDHLIVHRVPQPRVHHPATIMEDLVAFQHRETQTLIHDNHRLAAATYVGLKQELSAAQLEILHLSAMASAVVAETNAKVREAYEKSLRMEAKVHAIDELRTERAQVSAEIEEMSADRRALAAVLEEIEDELMRVRSELKQFPAIKAEIESLHAEIQMGRAAVKHEREMQAVILKQSQTMEKCMISTNAEIEILRNELADAEKGARAAAATLSPECTQDYGIYESGYGDVDQGCASSSSRHSAEVPYDPFCPYDRHQPHLCG